jgi:hypothetical protein
MLTQAGVLGRRRILILLSAMLISASRESMKKHLSYSGAVFFLFLTSCLFIVSHYCQHGTSVHKIHVNCISHVTLRHLLTHLGLCI